MYSADQGFSGDVRFQSALKKWAFVCSLGSMLIALLVLAGWGFDIEFLKSPLSYRVAMNPVTAVALLLSSLSFLFLIRSSESSVILKIAGYTLSVIVVVTGLWKLLNSLQVIDIQIDRLLFYKEVLLDIRAGRLNTMAPNTAFCLLLMSTALLLLPYRTGRGKMPSQYLVLLVGAVAFFSVLGYLYRVQAFYGILVYIPMAFHTAVALLLLSIAVLFATSDKGLMRTFTGLHAGSMVARFLVPAVIVVPVILGLLRLYGYWLGIFTTEFGVTVLVSSIVVFFLFLTRYTVRLLNMRDMEKEAASAALQKSEEAIRYNALLLQNISDAIVSTDIDFKVVTWNKAAEEMYGWTLAEALGKPLAGIVQPQYDAVNRDEILSAYFKNGYWRGEIIHHKKNGEPIWVLVSTTLIQKEGEKAGTVAVIRDITERKRAEENFRDLLNAAPDATVIVNSGGLIQMVNKRVEDLFGYQRNELQGKPVEILMPLPLREGHARHMKNYVQEPRVRPMGAGMELQARRKDATLFPVEISLSPLQTKDGLLVSASIRDITERRKIEQRLMQFNEELEQQVVARTIEIKESEQKILQFNEQLRQLSARLEEVREQERIRIAREIHDELGQQLTGLKMDIAWLSKKTGIAEVPVAKKFIDVLGLLDEMVKTVRRISTELRPAVLDDLGLLAAIEWHSIEFEKRFNIKVLLSVPEYMPSIAAEKATGVFRVYQEALTNIARHAGAGCITTAIAMQEGQLQLTVTDNGRGFDVQQAGAKKTLGLLGMRERVNVMGGRYEITSAAGKGTTILLEVPV